jgi:hypothetical protein
LEEVEWSWHYSSPSNLRGLAWEPAHRASTLSLVTAKVDAVAGIDYHLVAPLTATADNLDGQLKVRCAWRIHIHGSASTIPEFPRILLNQSHNDSFASLSICLPPSPYSSYAGSLSFQKLTMPATCSGSLHLLLPLLVGVLSPTPRYAHGSPLLPSSLCPSSPGSFSLKELPPHSAAPFSHSLSTHTHTHTHTHTLH